MRNQEPRPTPGAAPEDEWRLLVEATGWHTLEVDLAEGAIACDEGLRDLLELPRDAPLQWADLTGSVHPGDRERVESALQELMAAGGPGGYRDEFRLVRAAGQAERWVALSGKVFFEDHRGATRFIAMVQDTSDKRQAENDRERLIAELSRTIHFSEMFTGIVGHDLRSPLAAITTSGEILLRTETRPHSVEAATRILACSERMARMTEELLDFTRARIGGGLALKPRAGDLGTLTQQIVDELRVAHPRSQVEVTARGDTTGRWDIDRLAQVFSNLVGNAIQHGAGPEPVRIELDGSTEDQLTISVENRGVIPPELQAVLFDPFRTAGGRRDGSNGLGLGLYITHQIVLAHDGDIDVTSSAEAGTRFAVRLPRTPGAADQYATEGGVPEVTARELIAAAPSRTEVTARLFGSVALHERAPHQYMELLDRYTRLLGTAIDRQTYKRVGREISEELRAIAEELGHYRAGAREVAELHARALRNASRRARFARAQGLVTEGRLLSFELMGLLLSYYRRRAGFGPPAPTTRGEDG